MKKINTAELSFFLTRKYKLSLSIILGLFLYLFMTVFLPFGVSNYNPNHQYTLEFLLTMSIFMVTTTAIALFNEFVLKSYVVRSITLINLLFWHIWLLLSLGVANFMMYNLIGNWHDFHLSSAVNFVLECSTVFAFPLVGTFFYFRYQNLKFQYEQILTNQDQTVTPESLMTFAGQGTNEKVMISPVDFLYGKAQDNYVELVYVDNQSIKKDLLRTTMSTLLEGLDSKLIVRCHRSYMINLYNVRSLKTGSHLKLHLNHISQAIPVSKSFQDMVMDQLKEIKHFD